MAAAGGRSVEALVAAYGGEEGLQLHNDYTTQKTKETRGRPKSTGVSARRSSRSPYTLMATRGYCGAIVGCRVTAI